MAALCTCAAYCTAVVLESASVRYAPQVQSGA
jgi:hypothetical protein